MRRWVRHSLPTRPGDHSRPADHHVALHRKPMGVPAYCREPHWRFPFVRASDAGRPGARPVRPRDGERSATRRATPRHMTLPWRDALSHPTCRPASPLPLVTHNRRDRVSDDTISGRYPARWGRIAQRHCRCRRLAQIEQKGPGGLTKVQSPEGRSGTCARTFWVLRQHPGGHDHDGGTGRAMTPGRHSGSHRMGRGGVEVQSR